VKNGIASLSRTLIFPFYIILLLILSCGSGKPAVWEGLYLDYEVGTMSECRISFDSAEGKYLRVIFDPQDCSLRPEGYRKGRDLIVDKNLKPRDGGLLTWGEAVFIWLPENKRKVGSHWTVGGHFEVSRREHWREWDVAVVDAEVGMVDAEVGILKGTWYYDVDTGFLVGMEKEFGGERNMIYLLKDMGVRQAIKE
jgi:hypothetical protein